MLETISQAVASGQELDAILALILAQAVAVTRADRCCVLLVSSEHEEFRLEPLMLARSHASFEPRELFRTSQSAIRRVVSSHAPVAAHDAIRDESLSLIDSVRNLRLRSLLAVPIEVDHQVIAVLYADSRRAGTLTRAHAPALQVLADLAALAIQRAQRRA